jgi:cytochrome d ubiquinol oxidase subunit II
MLETIWFVIWGLLWAIYLALDGFDLGAGALLPFVAKNETERKAVYHAVEPYWDGNEVWLIAAGGVTFAAFPAAYAVLFSALYSPLMLILFALILRGAALGLRPETESAAGRKLWDVCFTAGSFLPMLLFGVAFANLLRGLPIDGDGANQGTILTLLNPQGLLGGIFFVVLLLMHGALWLVLKTDGAVRESARTASRWLLPLLLVIGALFAGFLLFSGQLRNDRLSGAFPAIAFSMLLAPLAAVALAIVKARWLMAWTASAAGVLLITLSLFLAMFPDLVRSSLDPAFSMTTANSASSPLTLKIMLGVVLCTVPVVIVYQAWSYRLFKGNLSEDGSVV